MYPILLALGSFKLYSFGLLVALGMLSAFLWLGWRCHKLNTMASEGVAPLFYVEASVWVILFSLLGARLAYFVYYPQLLLNQGWGAVFASGGLVWYGGVLAALVAMLAIVKLRPALNWVVWLDRLAPSVGLGLAFGRIGCFLAGCCFGAPCHLPWAVQYPTSHASYPHWVHPSPLYESVMALLLSLTLAWLESRKPATGRVAGLFFICFAVLRFAVESTRGDTIGLSFAGFNLGLSASQAISLAMAALGIVLCLRSKGQKPLLRQP
jgi:phosphatidylglycerol---prolipoprotein diacylglyceryl transferase